MKALLWRLGFFGNYRCEIGCVGCGTEDIGFGSTLEDSRNDLAKRGWRSVHGAAVCRYCLGIWLRIEAEKSGGK